MAYENMNNSCADHQNVTGTASPVAMNILDGCPCLRSDLEILPAQEECLCREVPPSQDPAVLPQLPTSLPSGPGPRRASLAALTGEGSGAER